MRIVFACCYGTIVTESEELLMYVDGGSGEEGTTSAGFHYERRDFIIETSSVRCRVKDCLNPYDMHGEIQECLKERIDEDAVYIDMYHPSGDLNSCFDNGRIVIEPLTV